MSMTEMMRSAMTVRKKEPAKVSVALDSAQAGSGAMGPSDYEAKNIAMSAAAAIQQWAETDDLDDGETFADRLMAMMIGIADENKDGEITDEEQEVVSMALEAAWDYLSSMGVSDDDCSALLNDWDADAGERVRDLAASVMPEGETASYQALESFVFGSEASESIMDAAYKNVMAIRGGKKMRIKKRISGTVRLNGKQRVAIRKAGLKSHSVGARMKRMKSMRIRKQMGL